MLSMMLNFRRVRGEDGALIPKGSVEASLCRDASSAHHDTSQGDSCQNEQALLRFGCGVGLAQ